jgi:hypothetical protein
VLGVEGVDTMIVELLVALERGFQFRFAKEPRGRVATTSHSHAAALAEMSAPLHTSRPAPLDASFVLQTIQDNH